jgi:P27 family predicted phage terminase small subunit
MGRKPQPVNVIRMKGKTHLTKQEIDDRLEAEARVRPPADKVRCPRWLDKEGRKEWRRICPELKALDLLTNVDVSALAVYCDVVSRYIEATKAVQASGFILRDPAGDGSGDGSAEEVVNPGTRAVSESADAENPAVIVAVRYARLIKLYLVEFGLSPSARAKLKPPEAKGEGPVTKFEKRFGAV